MIGTIVNVGAVVVGSSVGMLIHSKLRQKYIDIVFQALGLFTIAIGIAMSLHSENMLLIVLSIVSGSLIGQALDIEAGMDKLGKRLQKRFTKNKENTKSFTEGFLTATMLFCVGSMAILGAFEDGMGKTPNLLYTKSIMDCVASVALASSFGISVMFSVIPVLVYQGALTVFASFLMRIMSDTMINDFTAVGGIMLVGIGITLLKIKNIKVINMLPALVVILILSYFFGA